MKTYKQKLLERLGTSVDPTDRALRMAVLEIWRIVEGETNHVEANTEPSYQRIWEVLNGQNR